MSARSRSVPPIWLAALAAAVLVGVFAGEAFLIWMPVAAAGIVLLTFVVQLALQRKEGLVNRVLASIGGALIVFAVATVVLILLYPGAIGSLVA